MINTRSVDGNTDFSSSSTNAEILRVPPVSSVVKGFQIGTPPKIFTTGGTEDRRETLRGVLCSWDGGFFSGSQHSRKPSHRIDRFSCDAGSLFAGPGLLESAYQACLAHELRKRGIAVASQVGLSVVDDGEKIELGYRIDLVVENVVIVEVKCVEAIHPVHQAQLLSYMRLSGGLLIKFYVPHLRDGIKRMVDGKDWEK